ncbi:hypothetical protein [Nostoc punctiforme]|uniref:Uncharacterized protein n=2 Tax=Nostoc punctiforme TaxID=272131 RepID=B2ITA5_NOSP7|nr:hypothetical protein [Nostoc punctiforme]ACC81136.1 hypothetical protein Npun_R2582 [Nostoc punctiforme PCC 73102]RCJ29183.1 hypothetical protein A6769_35910 [Nostoc punctiforme NIES-2108]
MGFENGNDSTGTLQTHVIGGVDADGKVRAIAVGANGKLDIAASDSSAIGTISDIPANSDTANATLISLFKRLLQRLATLFDRPAITIIAGTINTVGDNTIIAAPGTGISINISYLKIQLEASTATTIILKSGATTKERILCQNQGDGLAINYFLNRELRLDANTALVLSLSGANSVNYAFHYYTL